MKAYLLDIARMTCHVVGACAHSGDSIGDSVDTQFRIHNLILEDDRNDHSKYQKNHNFISCIKSFIAYHKNDLEILTIAMICPVLKFDHQIERYHKNKFSWSACIPLGDTNHV